MRVTSEPDPDWQKKTWRTVDSVLLDVARFKRKRLRSLPDSDSPYRQGPVSRGGCRRERLEGHETETPGTVEDGVRERTHCDDVPRTPHPLDGSPGTRKTRVRD